MRLKLKEQNHAGKKFLLPSLKQIQQPRYTPRHKQVNSSLPKILPSFSDQRTYIPLKQKLKTEPNHSMALQKETASHSRKRVNASPLLFEELNSSNDYDEGNITSNFKREVQRNLIMIKRQKEYQKKGGDRARYNTPRHLTIEAEQTQQKQIPNRQKKCFTEQDSVFKKLNQIIIKSQEKSVHQPEEPRAISYSSYINNKKKRQSAEKIDSSREMQERKVKRCMSQLKRQLFKAEESIKNEGNYHEWRKLSIESDGSKKINYNISSFENEAARLEKIRSKNELSLKKYIEGKSYLQRLANYRQSAELLLDNRE